MTLLSALYSEGLNNMIHRRALKGYALPSTLGKLLKCPSADSKGSSSALPQDILAIAQPLRALCGSGVDLEKSRFTESAQALSFNLTYEEESFQQVSLQGYYNSYSEHLTADFSFISALAVKDAATGEERQELFRFSLHLEANHSLTQTGSSSVQKEDILQFARKLVTKIAKLHAEGKEIDGLALDSEDLKELGAAEDGRLLEHIMAIVQILRMISQMEKKEGDHVLVDLEREKWLVDRETSEEQESLDFSLTVERVQTQSASEEAPVPAQVEEG